MPLRLLVLPCLALVAAVLISCGGDDDDEQLSVAEYFQQLEVITQNADEATEETEDFDLLSSIVLAAIEQIDELNPPDEVREEHEAYVEALNDYAPLVLEFVEETEDLSGEELLEVDTTEIDEALARIDETCGDLQEAADSGDIDIDLECEGSTEDADEDVPAPDNDDRLEATIIDELPFTDSLDVSGAGMEDDELEPSCGSLGGNSGSVWYQLINETDGPIIVDTTGSTYDTVVAVYEPGQGDLQELACNDDAPGSQGSSLTFGGAMGGVYLIQVTAYGSSAAGDLQFDVRQGENAGENDDIDGATVIESLPFNERLDTTSYTTAGSDPIPMCGFDGNSATAWYELTAEEDLEVAVDTTGSSFDTVLAVYEGPQDALTEVTCNDDSEVDEIAQISFRAEAGTTYYIEVASYGDDPGGNLELSVTGD